MYTIPQAVTVSNKWQIVLTKDVRRRLRVRPKDKVIIEPISETKATIEIVADPIKSSIGLLRKYDPKGDSFKKMLQVKYEEIARDE